MRLNTETHFPQQTLSPMNLSALVPTTEASHAATWFLIPVKLYAAYTFPVLLPKAIYTLPVHKVKKYL